MAEKPWKGVSKVGIAAQSSYPKITYVQPEDPWAKVLVIRTLELMNGRRRVERIYHRLKDEEFDFTVFFGRGLELARIRPLIDPAQEALIPRDGPLVIIANHPFGIVDGVVLCDLAARTRGKFKILVHGVLCQDEELDPYLLPVDFRESPKVDVKEVIRNNIRTKQIAAETLADNGTLVVFPSGGVATVSRAGFGQLEDPPWTTFTAKLIHQTRANVVPVFFRGRNSWLFHFVSGFSETLRTSMLLHEAGRKIGKKLRVELGEPILYESLEHLGRRDLTRHLHDITWALGMAETSLSDKKSEA